MIRSLLELRYSVTFYSMSLGDAPEEACSLTKTGVEVILNHGAFGFRRFLKSRSGFYDACIISRPHNMARLKPVLQKMRGRGAPARIVYDAEALYCLREIEHLRLAGKGPSAVDATRLIQAELDLARVADAVLTVSPQEAEHFRQHRCERHGSVYVLPHTVSIRRDIAPYGERNGFLFVGALHAVHSPNADSIRWFLSEIWPLIREKSGAAAKIVIAGANPANVIFAGAGVDHVGQLDELEPLYQSARVFIAPTRFAAGVPLKLYEAAAAGIPIVATSLLAAQLGWSSEHELLVADTSEEFAAACIRLHSDVELWTRLQSNAQARTDEECSHERFNDTLEQAVSGSAVPTASEEDLR